MIEPADQRGAALLLLLVLLVVGGAALFLATRPQGSARLRAERETSAALWAAKQELIAFAVNYDQLYPSSSTGLGHFPCPDANGNGNPNTPCGPNALGRLPRTAPSASRTLWFGDHGAGTDRRLWYALADGFRDNPPGQRVNSNSAGTLTVNGTPGALAAIIEPGVPTVGQARPGNSYTAYLEGAEPAGRTYAAAGNDRVVGVYPREVIPLVTARVAALALDRLREYRARCGYYPAPVPYANPILVTGFDSATSGTVFEGLFPADTAYPTDWGVGCAPPLDLPIWVTANDWLDHAYYAIAESDPCIVGVDCLTVDGHSRAKALLVFPGVALNGQDRSGSGAGLTDYFEGENASPMDGIYLSRASGTAFNDQLFAIP